MTGPRDSARLLMVMPYHQLVRKAVEAGFRVWSIWDPSMRDDAYLREVAAHSEELLLVDFADEEALCALVEETAVAHAVGHVLHLGSESSMVPVVRVAERLGLSPNRADSVRLLNDKAATRELLNRNGISPVRVAEAAHSSQVADAARSLGFPCVVKPSRSAGSRGVALLRSAACLDGWVERIEAAGPAGPFVVEEYLRGPEFSVETLSVAGHHHVVGITAKETGGPPRFVERGHIHPAPLPEADTAEVRATVTSLLDLADFEFGPAHTEVILTEDGPRVVESQARFGGDRIPLLVDVAAGFDLEAAVFRALAGDEVPRVVPGRYAAVGFFEFPAGALASVTGLDEVRALPYVHALTFRFRPGDVLPPTTDSASRHGHVVVDAASPAEAAARIAAVRATVRVAVREDDPLPTATREEALR
ncbi:ATP-grasp domain-containing protein [Streptomyces sp. NBC_00859]|uniref:ATP-grasp domain-containing protein n=1 Tax=Streptomyces sp. NBC_00859 TaxID=2903682 RepID=UPI003867DCBD|nr:ATP-grasp domain-containing protein [Streptomyces sp. NBC_00859]